MINEKLILKTNFLINITKLSILVVFVFFAAKIRHSIGDSLIADGVFVLTCIISAFLFVMTYKTRTLTSGGSVNLTVHRNLLGLKCMVIQCESGEVYKLFTVKDSILFRYDVGSVDLFFTNLNGSEIYIEVIGKNCFGSDKKHSSSITPIE